MARIIDAFTQFFDDNGDPLVDGFLKFVESGTNNTDKDTFADVNEAIPNANPVPLDGAGRCPNVFGTGAYNVISYTNAMVQIQQFDPVSADTLLGAFSDWDSVTIYGEGDIIVGSDGLYYRSITTDNQNQNPVSSPGQWEEFKFIGVWNTNITYTTGDSVYGSDGILYLSLTGTNLGNNPTTDTTNWGNSSIPEWIAGATYSIGNLVFGSDGFLYSSNIDSNIGNDPISDPDSWSNAAAQGDQIQSITGTVASSALTVGLNTTVLDFRDAVLTDGSVTAISITAALSLIVPLGATLGTIDAIQSRLILLAIDNAGTVELAIVNLAGGNNLDETTLISITTIDATADSDNVIYSTTSRSSVPFRVVGYIESTQATAGTWLTAPSALQGAGGNALTSMSSLGYGQTWQTVTRTAGTTYYNTTGRPITYSTGEVFGSATVVTVSVVINGGSSIMIQNAVISSGNSRGSGLIIIPVGASYVFTHEGVSSLTSTELR